MNTNIPQLLSAVRLCDPCKAHKQPVWIAVSAPCFYVFDCCFIQQFHSTTPLAKLTRNLEKSLVPILCDFVTLLCHFGFFLLVLDPSPPLSFFFRRRQGGYLLLQHQEEEQEEQSHDENVKRHCHVANVLIGLLLRIVGFALVGCTGWDCTCHNHNSSFSTIIVETC